MRFFTEIKKNNPKVHMETQKIQNSQSDLEKKRTKLEASHFLISKYITKIKKLEHSGTGIKTDM